MGNLFTIHLFYSAYFTNKFHFLFIFAPHSSWALSPKHESRSDRPFLHFTKTTTTNWLIHSIISFFLVFVFLLSFFRMGTALPEDPEFTDVIENITVPAGRNIKLACSVKNLGSYKVWPDIIICIFCVKWEGTFQSIIEMEKIENFNQKLYLMNF